ncbi:MAG: polysaccharide deacetylase family protein, partial [Fibrobacter sp.]|nr:polysaccharide deacetylase family protein [Fibrobacter sp.]
MKATFFIIGRQAETRPYLLQREIDEGHTVAVHSYTHDYSQIYKSGDALEKDINKCNQVIEKITGKKSHLYRFPGGS